MSSSVSARLRYPGAAPRDPAEARRRSVRLRIGAVWFLLFFNTMTYVHGVSVLDLPSKIGKGLAQGSLPLAILLALSVNPKLKIRPNVFLSIMSLLILDASLTAMQVHHLGTIFRTFRLAEYLFALWLLTPWWGGPDMMLFRWHLRCLYAALVSVFVGMLIAPGRAFAYQGRLMGVIWPMFPTQVAQYAAVALGLTVVLWYARLVSGRLTLAAVAFDMAILLLSHTRTALVALLAGLLVAGLSLFASNGRVRRFFAAAVAAVTVAFLTVASFVVTWLARGESAQGLTSLTGRTNFWALVLDTPRDRFQEVFGFGLSNASINGLPIDSNWLSAYMQEGLFGVVVCGAAFVFLLVTAFFKSTGTRRALSLFLVTYCLIASFTEDSITDVSPYLLNLVVAASLFMASRPRSYTQRAPEAALAPEVLEEVAS